MAFAKARFATSGVPPKVSIDFDQVNAQSNCNPFEIRLLAVNCSELYQLSPSGGFTRLMVVYCGKGRRACATEDVSGKPANGILFWKRPAAAEPMGASSVAKSAGLFRFSPLAAKIAVLR